MGDTIVKASPDEDFYVVISSIVDAPNYWGTRAELEAEYEHSAPRRFDDADRTGTSSRWSGYKDMAWDDDTIIIREGVPEGGILHRRDLKEFCLRLEDPDRGEPQHLLSPFEDADD